MLRSVLGTLRGAAQSTARALCAECQWWNFALKRGVGRSKFGCRQRIRVGIVLAFGHHSPLRLSQTAGGGGLGVSPIENEDDHH